ncbi:MAG: aldo/keto reductase [Halanaerobium sp.]|nr:aldo/keto reductase [Halanaerobium sp.]
MKAKWLGKTGLKVQPLGFGGIPIQRINEEEAVTLIQEAIDRGINFIDTARGYTDSEKKIGLAIQGLREKIILASKSPALTYRDMKRDIEISLEQLGVETIELYQVHNLRSEDDFHALMASEGGYKALQEAREAGIIKHIGITGHDVDLLVETLKTGRFETVQAPFNAIEDQAKSELFSIARDREVGIIVMKPLAGGAIKSAGPALRYILEHDISVVIPGMENIQQLAENLQAAAAPPLQDNERKALLAEADELGRTFCRRCGYCLPCPEGIDIPTIFILEGYHDRYQMADWARERYSNLAIQADRCEECGICEEKCPYQLPIREMLQTAHSKLGS